MKAVIPFDAIRLTWPDKKMMIVEYLQVGKTIHLATHQIEPPRIGDRLTLEGLACYFDPTLTEVPR